MAKRVVTKVYVNTSVLIAAAWPSDSRHKEALKFFRETGKRNVVLITSSITLYEVEGKRSEEPVKELIRKFKIHVFHVNLFETIRKARRVLRRLKLSPKREIDVAHVLAAKHVNAKYLVTYDRKLRSLARRLGIKGCYPIEFLREDRR